MSSLDVRFIRASIALDDISSAFAQIANVVVVITQLVPDDNVISSLYCTSKSNASQRDWHLGGSNTLVIVDSNARS